MTEWQTCTEKLATLPPTVEEEEEVPTEVVASQIQIEIVDTDHVT
jgi:hypothetical protein